MKIFKIFSKKTPRKSNNIVDFYQASIEKVGRDQIKKLADKGLGIPVLML